MPLSSSSPLGRIRGGGRWYLWFCNKLEDAMTPNLTETLPLFRELAKPREVVCRCCHWSGPCPKFGFYQRFDPDGGDSRIKVQRYLCLNPDCPVVTFSVLPFRVLPLIGTSVFLLWLGVALRPILSVRLLARTFDCARSTIRRRCAWGKRFIGWLGSLANVLKEVSSWDSFCHLLSRAFYPRRWPPPASTQFSQL